MTQGFARPISDIEPDTTRGSVSEDRWGELMRAAQAGNCDAYRCLLREVLVWLRRYYARRLLPSHVDDVVQEALVAIHVKRHTYAPGRPFRAWMAGIARHKWIDKLRSIKRDRFDALQGFDAAVEDHGAAVSGRLDVEKLLAQLKPAQAEVIRLVKLEGFSIEEASVASGQSMALVKVNVHRGIARLACAIDRGTAEMPGGPDCNHL